MKNSAEKSISEIATRAVNQKVFFIAKQHTMWRQKKAQSYKNNWRICEEALKKMCMFIVPFDIGTNLQETVYHIMEEEK
jgi:hypothetical protein